MISLNSLASFHSPNQSGRLYKATEGKKNVIPFHEKCIAKAANGEQCSRKERNRGVISVELIPEACPHGVITGACKGN